VVAEADDAAADLRFAAAAAGGAEAVNLGVARAKGETKEEKKARKEAVKLQVLALPPYFPRLARACMLPVLFSLNSAPHFQRSANRAAKKQLKEACAILHLVCATFACFTLTPHAPLPQIHQRDRTTRASGRQAKHPASVALLLGALLQISVSHRGNRGWLLRCG